MATILNIIEILVILVVGFFAFVIYIITRRQEKQNAARIILMEIRNAEKSFSAVNDFNSINETLTILPTNSWSNYNHFFVKAFDQDELSLVNDFYAKGQIAENERKVLNNFLNVALEEKSKCMVNTLTALALDDIKNNADLYECRKELLVKRIHAEKYYFEGISPRDRILSISKSITFITTSSAGQKLKRIAKIKY